MKIIILPILIILLGFFFIGLFLGPKNFSQQKVSFSFKPPSTTTPFENLNPFLKGQSELQQRIDQEVAKLTENLIPDGSKSLTDYRNEIAKIQEKFKIENNQNLSPEFFIDLAKELSKIRPPTLFYQFHLELIKIYYSIGLALKEFQETNDPTKQIMLYNFIEANLKKLKIK